MSEVTKEDILNAQKTLNDFQETIKNVGTELKTYEDKFKASDADTKEKLAKITAKMAEDDKKLQDAMLKLDGIKNQTRSKEEEIKELEEVLKEKSITKEKAEEMATRIKDLELALAKGVAKVDDKKAYIESDEYKSLTSFAKKDIKNMTLDELKYLRTDNNASGGFLVPVALHNQIMEEIEEQDPIRPLARVFSSKNKTLEIPIRTTLPVATYEGEAEAVSESNSGYRLEQMTAYAQSIKTRLTWDMINFAAYDIIQQASKDAAMAFAIGEGTGFLKGTGVKQPEGILTNADVLSNVATSATSGAVSLTDVIQLPGFLKSGYINNARFFMNQKTLFALRSEQDGSGNFLWRVGGEGMPNNIAGIPYVILPGMANVASDSLSVGVGDFFYGYYILDAVQIAMVRDEFTEANKRMVNLIWFKWNTGQVGIPEAFKVLKTKH